MASGTKFKVGDTVVCTVQNHPAYGLRTDLTVGARYEVTGFNGSDVKLKGIRASCDPSRFDLLAPASNAVTRPAHYVRFKIEPIRFIEENSLPFGIGNVIKYVCRYDAKDGIQDLKKARRYLDMIIKRLEGDAEWNG